MKYLSLSLLFLFQASISCDKKGGSSTYSDIIENNSNAHRLKVRHIEASGCPNHPNDKVGDNPNDAGVQSHDYTIPAYPCYSNNSNYDVTCTGSAIGIALNGVSIFSPFAGGVYGCPVTNVTNAVTIEGDTFDACSGHATGDMAGYEYHYHVAPSCLLDQLHDYSNVTQHSPIIGWALDGFPIYGTHGIGGNDIYPCNHSKSNNTDCLDECHGHDQHEIGGFKYHYHVLGPLGDLVSTPLQPLPSSDLYPYTIGCLKGVPFSWSDIQGSTSQNENAVCESEGTTNNYQPQSVAGMTEIYTPAETTSSANKHSLWVCLVMCVFYLFF